jgi:hypothetical protein
MRATRPDRAGIAVALALLIAPVAAACGGSGDPGGATSSTASGGGSSAATTASAPSVSPSASPSASPSLVEKETEDVDLTAFANPTVVDNKWFPLTPGTQLTFTGASDVDGERLAHDVIFTVTDLVKTIQGVANVAIYEQDYTEGVLNEAELAFFAQADDGTIWHFGQYPEVYEDGKMVEAPTWISGQKGSKAGITMRAEPVLGQPSYAQGWGPSVDWKDRGRVIETGKKTCVKAGCYSDVLVVEESVVGEPESFQLKYYAPGLGNVQVGWAGKNEPDHEELELVKTATLDAAGLAAVRKKALALEKSAYAVSKDVYGTTEPMLQP